MEKVNFKNEDRFSKIAFLFSFITLSLGGLFGFLQLLSRTPNFLIQFESEIYYMFLTGHGVLLAIVWTAFFIMGLAVFVVSRELKINLNSALLNLALMLSITGTVLAAYAILIGQANVLYTFYPPLKAHPLFYIGATILVIGTWIFSLAIFLVFFKWRKNNKEKAIPLGTFGVITTLIVWLEATPGLAIEILKNLIPMALFNTPVDVLESRTYFWYFGHPLVYFWVIPAITLWYYFLPKLLNVELFSEKMAKVTFILFILASTPVGLHHQLVDPGISSVYKYLHTILTYSVATASFLTAFNILATLEKVRKEKLFDWLKRLPWKNPSFTGIIFAFILFGFGGIGGIINTSFTFNYIVHNTLWVVGHFHLMVGTAVTLTFIAISYLLIPILFGKSIIYEKIASIQPYLWFIGMFIFSFFFHIAGVLGVPRRVASILYYDTTPQSWITLTQLGAIGGVILFVSGILFIFLIFMSIIKGKVVLMNGAEIINPKFGKKGIIDKLSIWIFIAVVLILLGYSLPLIELYSRGLIPVSPVLP